MATVAELWEEQSAPSAAPVQRTQPSLMSPVGATQGRTVADLWESTPEESIATATAKPVRESEKPFEQRTIKGLAKQYLQEAAVYPDIVAGAITSPAMVTGYLTRRAMGESPEQAQQTVESYMRPIMSPVGTALGITQEPGYAESAPQQIMRTIGETAQVPIKALSEKTGIAESDISNVLGAAGIVAPVVGPAVKAIGKAGASAIESGQEAMSAFRPVERQALTSAQALEQFRAAGGQVPYTAETAPGTMRLIGGQEVPAQTPISAGAIELTAGPAKTAASVGAAEVAQRPYTLSGEETARGTYPQVKLHKIGETVPVEEQQLRAQIVNDIMQGKGGVRTGVVTGDENILRNEYERAKLTDKEGNLTPEAELLRQQIAAEQNALSDYAKQRVEATQADPLLRDDYARGQRLNDAVYGEDGLYGEINRQKRAIYDEARQVVGDNPVETPNVNSLLSSRQFKGQIRAAKQSDFTSGLQDLLDLHKEEGFAGTTPNSIASLEELRKAANALRTPDNARFVGQVINAIDEDIASAGGPGLYERAREVHRAEKELFGPKGMQKIFGQAGEAGIKEGAPLEKMVTELNRLPFDEWSHIHDTFETLARGEMPGNLQGLTVTPELQAYAQSALNEMKGAISRDIYEAGATKAGEWNANAANKAMNQYSRKIQHAFDPAEQVAFHNLNYGGQMMPGSLPYAGAARQARTMANVDTVGQTVQKGAKVVEAGAAAKGIPTFGLPSKAAEYLNTRRSKEAAARQAMSTQRELQGNSQLPGMTLEDIAKMRPK